MPSTLGVVASGEDVLNDAVFWIDAALSSTVSGAATNLGKGGSALNAQYGSTSGTDTNDPTLLAHTGTNYLYLPGISGNFVSVPDPSVLAGASELDVRGWLAATDWTPSSGAVICAQSATSDQNVRFYLAASSTGRLVLDTSTNGTTVVVATSSVAPTVTDGSPLGARATWRASDGRVQFFTKPITTAADLSDNAGWTQLGTNQTGVVGNLFNSTGQLAIGTNSPGTSEPLAGQFYRVWIATTIDGAAVIDVDFTTGITSGGQTTFTCATGQTATINSAATGRKAVAVVRPILTLGLDDIMQVADDALLDFGPGESFTVLAVFRGRGTFQTALPNFISKSPAAGLAAAKGWSLRANVTTNTLRADIGDGTTRVTATGTANTLTGSPLNRAVMVVDHATNLMQLYLNGAADGAAANIAAVGDKANALPVRSGSPSDSIVSNNDFELAALAVWRRAITANEIATVSARYA
jgi:hypothetical protein